MSVAARYTEVTALHLYTCAQRTRAFLTRRVCYHLCRRCAAHATARPQAQALSLQCSSVLRSALLDVRAAMATPDSAAASTPATSTGTDAAPQRVDPPPGVRATVVCYELVIRAA
jgi:hypothetical protein